MSRLKTFFKVGVGDECSNEIHIFRGTSCESGKPHLGELCKCGERRIAISETATIILNFKPKEKEKLRGN